MIKNRNKGSLTVEASIVLVIFIFGFISVLSLCKFAMTQIIIQHSINQVAREMSQYSYITNKLGFNRDVTEKNQVINNTDELISEAVKFITVIQDEEKNVSQIDLSYEDEKLDSFDNAIGVFEKYEDAAKTIKKSYENIDASALSMIGQAEEYFKDPNAVLRGFLLVAKNEIADYAISKFIASPMSKLMVEKYIETESLSADKRLKKLGVINGVDGLNFDLSTLFCDGKTINITVIYSMKLDIPLFPKKDFVYKLNASTLGWQSNLGENELIVNDNKDSGKSFINIWDYGGERTTNEFINIIKNERSLATVRIPVGLDFYDNNKSIYTYVHSMNTEMKSYCENGELKLNTIKNKAKHYCNKALEDIKKIDSVVMTDGIKYPSSSKNIKCKVIIVIQKSALVKSEDIQKIVEQIKKELKADSLDIEFYYSDGIVEVNN
ncbi:hypothetical protein JYG23_08990 [Sedimentibacter sp. zth1]|uniref:TadE family protein n=1 Tax=Sedimentibacter sp. zth1 TaxID=2816908 RepID=UPI001A91916D|nr:TadE family protein [Sedimentibacter sp. zth1]QSX04838.1 hypothetical protein JYG23_08990 [Sedimentibacter sp. zth1]